MKVILDTIVGSTPLFICVMLFLVSTFVVLMRSVLKQLNNHKIPIYDEDDAVEDAKADNVIEKPKKKKSKEKEEPDEEKTDEVKEEKTEDAEEVVAEVEPEVEEPVQEEAPIESSEPEKEEPIIEEIVEPIVEEEVVEIGEITALEAEVDEAKLEELENIPDEIIEARIDNEHKEEIEAELEKIESEEIKEILVELKDAKEIDPEEAVRSFENEQESQSIISYQELVEVVKGRDNEFIDELEAEPLTTVSDFIPESKIKPSQTDIEILEVIEQLETTGMQDENIEVEELLAISDNDVEELAAFDEEVEELAATEELNVAKEEVPENGRFQKTEVISPVYGRISLEKEIEYPKVEKFNRDPEAQRVIVKLPPVEEVEEIETIAIEPEEEELTVVEELEVQSEPVEEVLEVEEELEVIENEAPIEPIRRYEKVDHDLMSSLMPKLDVTDDDDETPDEDPGVRETLGAFNDMLENVTIELTRKSKKRPEQIVNDISSDTEEIMALTATHNFSQDEEFLKALKEFKENL